MIQSLTEVNTLPFKNNIGFTVSSFLNILSLIVNIESHDDIFEIDFKLVIFSNQTFTS